MLFRCHGHSGIDAWGVRVTLPLGRGEPEQDWCPRRDRTNPLHQLPVADKRQRRRAHQDEPEAGHGEHFERSVESLLIPQEHVRSEDMADQRVHEGCFEVLSLNQEDWRWRTRNDSTRRGDERQRADLALGLSGGGPEGRPNSRHCNAWCNTLQAPLLAIARANTNRCVAFRRLQAASASVELDCGDFSPRNPHRCVLPLPAWPSRACRLLVDAGMAAPTPLFRQVPAEILCTLGWVYGILHMPAHQTLDELLVLSGPSLKLTKARVPGESDPLGFLALRRDGISMIAPAMGGPVMQSGRYGPTSTRQVACLLSEGMLRGTAEVPVTMRLSDFLRLDGPFLSVRHGLLAPYGATLQSPGAKAMDLVLVNLDHVAGVSEIA